MPGSSYDRNFVRYFNLALLVVTAVALVLAFFSNGFALFSAKAWTYYGFLTIYAAGGCAASLWFCDKPSNRALALYFAVQLAAFGALARAGIPFNSIWLLAMPMISQAAATLPLPWLVALTVGYLAADCVLPPGADTRLAPLLHLGLSLASAYVFVICTTMVAMSARKAQGRAEALYSELERANEQLRAAAGQAAELAAANERNRIAREIHDGLGHHLTAIAVQLQATKALLQGQPERAAEAVARAEEASRQALDDVRRSIGALRTLREPMPLEMVIAGLVRESSLDARFLLKGAVRPVADAPAQALYRVAQEGLTNVRKHAGNARTDVTLDFCEPGRVRLLVTDNGNGRADPAVPVGGGFGLAGLRERIAALGGTFKAGARSGGGFELVVEVEA